MIFDEMKQTITPLMDQIYLLPFNRELSQGILDRNKFVFYLAQDILYLGDYARALALTAARLTNNNQTQHFIQFALDAILAERKLHLDYINTHAVDTLSCEAKTEQSPFCFMYTNYLIKMASTSSIEEAVAALIPCFYVYYAVGQKALAEKQCPNPYSEWIELYSSEQFYSSVKLAISIINELGSLASSHVKKNMINAFVRSTQLELNFWKGAYALEKW